MAGIQTPFAVHHHRSSSYDGTSTSPTEQPNNAARELSRGFTLDDSFNLPPCPSLDDFLMHALENAAENAAGVIGGSHLGGPGALPRIPSRLLTMSAGKSLSAMASLDLSWLADFPSAPCKGRPASRAHSLARKPSLAEQLVGPEQLGSIELPSAPPLNTKTGFKRPTSAAGTLPPLPTPTSSPPSSPSPAKKSKGKNQINTTPTKRQKKSAAGGSTSSSDTTLDIPITTTNAAAEAAVLQVQAAHASLVEAQAAYIKLLEESNNNKDENTGGSGSTMPRLEQLEKIAAAQQHVAMEQSYFGAALMNAQQFSFSSGTGVIIGGGLFPSIGSNNTNGMFSTNHHNLNSQYLTSAATTTMLAPKTPSESRMSALAQWEQERALMQALNSSDMETAVQACSGIINIAGGGSGAGGVPQAPPGMSFDHSTFIPLPYIGGSGPTATTNSFAPGGLGDHHQGSPTPPLGPLNVKVRNGVIPMVCLTHSQPIKVQSTPPRSASNSPMR